MLFGDVTYGGIQRAYLEKVGGEYQGAVFRHTQDLEAGVTRISVGRDGALYAGGLGTGGNWGQEGKLSHGLQKPTPNGTDAFDIHAVRAVPGGFALDCTQPLSTETATDLVQRYKVEQWRYAPTAAYGGPMIGEETLTARSATLSTDRKTVTLALPGLKADRVVHLRSPRPFSWRRPARRTSGPPARRGGHPCLPRTSARWTSATGRGSRPFYWDLHTQRDEAERLFTV